MELVGQELPKIKPPSQKAAAEDLVIIEQQMAGYQVRLDLWCARVWELDGFFLDPEGRTFRHRGRESSLTKGEFPAAQVPARPPTSISYRRPDQ